MKSILFGAALVTLGIVIGLVTAWIAGTLGLEARVLDNLVIGVFLLVGGFFCGFVIEWIIDEAYRKNRELRQQMGQGVFMAKVAAAPVGEERSDASSDIQVHELRDQVASMDSQIDHLRTEFDVYRRTHPDDLAVVKGIGPVYQWKLRDAGVHTYRDLAESDAAQLRRMLDIKDWQRVDIASWIEQARDWAQREP